MGNVLEGFHGETLELICALAPHGTVVPTVDSSSESAKC